MYGKLFESMYDGTLSGNWKALITFQQLIILADKEGYVDITPAALSRRTGIPIEIIEYGIEELEQPDKDSRSDTFDGRRIVRLDDHRPWGWQIVNYERYRDLANMEERREQNRARQQSFRDRQKSDTDCVTDRNADVTDRNTCNDMKMHIADAQEKETITNVKSLPEMSVKIPLKDGSYYSPEREDVERWRRTYPTLDLCEHLRACADWNEVNPGKRKTLRGVRRHMSTWLGNVGKPAPWQTDDVDLNAGRHQAFPCD